MAGMTKAGLYDPAVNSTYPPDIARFSSSLWARLMLPPCEKLASRTEPRSPLERGFFFARDSDLPAP